MENKVTRLFDEKSISISEFARKAGIPYGTLYDIARGKVPLERISIGVFSKIAGGFGMTLDELVGESQLDAGRFELCDIYDQMPEYGKRALLATAQALGDEFRDDSFAELCEQRYQDSITDSGQ